MESRVCPSESSSTHSPLDWVGAIGDLLVPGHVIIAFQTPYLSASTPGEMMVEPQPTNHQG